MEWINEPLLQGEGERGARDNCIAQICWARGEGGACVVRWCVTKICIKDY